MADHARSDSPAVQAQLDRFAQLSPGRDILGLERIAALMEVLGNPHLSLPPVFHVAGTNGKGSTCAFLRAILEGAGHSVHVYSSPHLVRFNERFRVSGSLIEDEALAALLKEVLDAAEAAGFGPSFFEATTAAAFLAFSRTPADAAIIEVGLGGRLDATNIIPAPLVCGIAQLGIDHEAFLLAEEVGTPEGPLERIAFEKAGIAKRGVPLVSQSYDKDMMHAIAEQARRAHADYLPRGEGWNAAVYEGKLHYRDGLSKMSLPLPALAGSWQAENAALAIAMLRHQSVFNLPESAYRAGMGWARWPARMQPLHAGPLVDLLPAGSSAWLDGCHNPAAAEPVAAHMAAHADARPLHIVCGMLANKEMEGVLGQFVDQAPVLHCVPVPGHEHHTPAAMAAWARAQGLEAHTAPDVETAFRAITQLARVLVMGSLYLAGVVLRGNDQIPD